MIKRLGYIDALRGITMLLVIFSHVELFTFGVVYTESLINSFFVTFRMPLFFFISGFIAYKKVEWDKAYYIQMLKKKSKIQILPTLFFYFLFYCICGAETPLSIFDKGPQGYWFTLTLFYMFFIYYTIMYLSECLSSRYKDYILFVVAVIGALIYIGGMKYYNLWRNPILCLIYLSRYFEFFILGIFCRKYYSVFERYISSERVKSVLILSWLLCFIIAWNETIIGLTLIHIFNLEFLLRYLGLFSVFALFYHYRNTFDSENRIVRGLRFIGRRTLDIYLLHYFFLPDLKSFASSYSFIFTPQNTVIELVVVLSFSIVIVLMCLGVSAIIRSSPLLGHYLFGAKR